MFDYENLARIAEARGSLYYFSRLMFKRRRGYNWLRAAHHKQICDALERVYNGQCRRLIINIPPRYSKTELAVVNFVAWAMGKAPDSEFIHASYSSNLATNNSKQVRDLMQHEAYAEVFATRLEGEAKSHWTTSDGGVMYATGAGGTITGFGAGKQRDGFGGAIIIDDPHKADEAGSEVVRAGVIDWFRNTIESRCNAPHTPIIVIMQRLHEEDLSGWLLAGGNGEKWEHLCIPAITDDGAALWPEKHSIERLRMMQDVSPYVFAGQYMQRPSPLEGGEIKPHRMPIIDALPAGQAITWARGWDFAATVDGDFTVGAKLGALEDGRFVIADIVRGQWTSDDRDAVMRQTAKMDGGNCRQLCPQDAGQAGKVQSLYITRMLAGFAVEFSPESGDKMTRARPLAAQINVGNVLLLRGEWNKGMIEELAMFPNGKHDDQVDALSRAFSATMNATTGILDYLSSLRAN